MKRIFLSLLFSVYFLSVQAQEFSFPAILANTKNNLLITSDFSFGSNAITYEIAETYALNGFITDEMKEQVTKNLDDKNRAGLDFTSEIYFRHTPDSFFGTKNWSWYVGLKNIEHLNAKFPPDLFEVFFRGNKGYAGKTADFSDFNYLYLKYQQLQFGFSKLMINDSSTWEAGGALGFNLGQQLLQIQSSPRTDLYTEESGAFLDLNAHIEMRTSDSLKKNFGSSNGFGISTDLYLSASIKERHFFFFKVSNLGFIRWNDNSAEIKADTSFHFEGINVDDLFTFSDTILTSITTDSALVQDFLTQRKYQSYYLFLPAKIDISYKRPLGHHHVRAGIGVNYIFNADYLPQLRLDFDHTWKNNMIALNVSYGGYTQFGAGLFYQHQFKRGYAFMIGSDYFNAWFNLNDSRSQNTRITIYRNF